MNPNTRTLIRLLANPGVRRLLKRLEANDATAGQLVRSSGAGRSQVGQWILTLERLGLIDPTGREDRSGTGRRSMLWRYAKASEIKDLEAKLDAFTAEMRKRKSRRTDFGRTDSIQR